MKILRQTIFWTLILFAALTFLTRKQNSASGGIVSYGCPSSFYDRCESKENVSSSKSEFRPASFVADMGMVIALVFLGISGVHAKRNKGRNRASDSETLITRIVLEKKKGIIQVNKLEIVKVLYYTEGNLAKVSEFLKNKKADELESFKGGVTGGKADELSVWKFTDQNNGIHFVTVFDNDELWHDPEVIEIYAL
jgi:hypothetical protein